VEKLLALDREDTLKKAEKLLRQGRLDAAIAEYVRVVEDQPRDWNTANTLGDLYVRAKQADKAVAQYARIAEHFFHDGFYPKAAALYKKILKISPNHEQSQLQLADLSAKQGLLADAKSYYQIVAARRRAARASRGVNEIVVLLGSIDPADIDARTAAARVLAENGDEKGASVRFRELYADLSEKERHADALKALREAVRLNPGDIDGRAILARTALAAGDIPGARGYLDRETAGEDPSLLMALVDIGLRAGDLDQVRELLAKLLALKGELRHDIVEVGWKLLSQGSPDGAFVYIDAAVNATVAAREFDDAASILQEFVTRQSAHVPALLKLVEVCVDGGLEAAMCEAQAQLADAYLAAGQGAEARAISEDLVAREPWEGAHIDRFRLALIMLRVPEPDVVIAERLSGQIPFVATDHFSSSSPVEIPPVQPEPAAEPEKTPPALTKARQAEPAQRPAARQPAAAVPEPPAPPPKRRGLVEIDLTNVLGELEDSTPKAAPAPARPADLDEVFKGFRTEAARNEGADQSAQHMKLARTYLEMGMLEEATASLTTAARSPRHRFEAASLLGRLYKEHGDNTQAIQWFERAAEAPAPGTDEARALLYDLGVALEDAGENTRALALFLELQAEAGEYRDVSERADRLARVQTGG
jgi:tetratricopeptide (TPR) repeat protein